MDMGACDGCTVHSTPKVERPRSNPCIQHPIHVVGDSNNTGAATPLDSCSKTGAATQLEQTTGASTQLDLSSNTTGAAIQLEAKVEVEGPGWRNPWIWTCGRSIQHRSVSTEGASPMVSTPRRKRRNQAVVRDCSWDRRYGCTVHSTPKPARARSNPCMQYM